MLNRFYWFIIPIIAVCIAFSALPVRAQDKEPPAREGRVGILDIGVVQRNAKVAQDMERQIRDKRVKFSEEVKSLEDGLRKAAEELERQRVLLAPEAFRKQQEELRQKSVNDQRVVQERQNQINAMRTEASKVFEKVLLEAVVKFARENDFMMVFRSREVVFFERVLDITPKIIVLMDKSTPAHKLSDAPPAGSK